MAVELLDPVHDETETKTGGADGEQLRLLVLVNRKQLRKTGTVSKKQTLATGLDSRWPSKMQTRRGRWAWARSCCGGAGRPRACHGGSAR